MEVLMDEIMERFALEGETLGFFSWITGKGWSKPASTSISAQYHALNNEINALIAKINQKKAKLRQVKARMKTTAYRRPTSRQPFVGVQKPTGRRSGADTLRRNREAIARILAARTARARAARTPTAGGRLTRAERAEYNKRMRWGWAQRPGAPDRPGEAAAKRRSYAGYKRDLGRRVMNIIIRKRRQGWARRPGAPDRPGEAAAKMRRAGVYLGDDTLEQLDEELLL